MDQGLVTALSGAMAQSRRIDMLANNLANSDVPAFKRDDVTFEETLAAAHVEDTRADIPERNFSDSELLSRAGHERTPVLHGKQFTQFQQGALRQTSNPFDLAIEGNGFLEVLTGDGVRLTRAGNLALDPQGRLTTTDGFLVLGAVPPSQATRDPALRALRLPPGGMVVDREGNVYGVQEQGNVAVGQLSLVQVANPAGLKKVGRNMYQAGPEAVVLRLSDPARAAQLRGPAGEIAPIQKNPLGSEARAPSVRQGFIEASNVNPIQEMSQLIEAHRLFEQNTRMMQTLGNIQSQASEVGKY